MNSAGPEPPDRSGAATGPAPRRPIICMSPSRTSGWYSTTNSPRASASGIRADEREAGDVGAVAFGVEQRDAVAGRRPWPSTGWCRRPSSARPHWCRASARSTTPMLAETTTSVPVQRGSGAGRCRARSARRAASSARLPASRSTSTTNSSPPIRATRCPSPAQRGREPLRDGAQQRVAGVVAQGVVDGLEPVQVEVAHPDAAVRTARRECRRQAFEEQGPVGQPGERVVQGLVAQTGLQAVPLGDVLDHRHHVARLPVRSRISESTRSVQIALPSLR